MLARILAAIVLAGGSLLVTQTTAFACRAPNGMTYTPRGGDFANFTFGQASQLGNQYYGMAGQLSTTYPTDPRYVDQPTEHVNGVMGSVDSRFADKWVFTGWVVGYSQAGGVSSATIFAEINDVSGLSQVLSGAAPGNAWYKTQLIGQDSITGNRRYGAYKNDGVNWIYIAEGQLTSSTTESQAFGEATNPLLSGNTAGLCRKESEPSTADNTFASMQLFVNNAVWDNWEPAFGLGADFLDEQGYRRTSTRSYTDQAVGGCIPC